MIRRINRRKFIIGSAGLLAAPSFGASSPVNFRVAVFNDSAPFSEFINDSYWEGYYIDLARRMIQGIENSQLEFVPDLAWNRLIKDIEFGRMDMLYKVSYREERTSFIDYIGVSDVDRKYLIVAEDNPVEKIDTFDDLANVSPAILLNETVAQDPEFDRLVAEDPSFRAKFNIGEWFMTVDSDPYEQYIQLISARRDGGFIINEIDVSVYIEKAAKMAAADSKILRLKALKINCFKDDITYLGVSRKVPQEYRDIMKQNYEEARADGSFDLIWSQWRANTAPPPNIPAGEKAK